MWCRVRARCPDRSAGVANLPSDQRIRAARGPRARHPGAGRAHPGGGMGPGGGHLDHPAFLWDGWVLMLPGAFVAAVLATALALNGPGEALYHWLRARFAPDPRRDRWTDAVARHRATALAYADFECDLRALLRLPALADVEQPATARFIDAFAEANALRTEEFPGPAYAPRFVAAVERAEQAWAAAVEA